MTNTELIALYNPANAANLSDEQIAAMQELTTEQIDTLAKAYPNIPSGRPYLVLKDTKLPDNRQLYPLSTWQNLRNLHKFHSQTTMKAYTFQSRLQAAPQPQPQGARRTAPAKAQVVDLTAQEAAADLRRTLRAKKDAEGATAQEGPAPDGQKKAGTKTNGPRRTSGKAAPTPTPATTPTTSQQLPADQQVHDPTEESK